ncbi:hypothetical protein FOMPIDRAFT_85964 [Fomitopsis schrenkii]|uniref:DUF6534 domain-containing protein n=1 Tax=Fomitopsis schrenkii TaxID=2126942 RepID=S8E770_FOMSC|nr:hypothetical protein FOMPIDRAFT_85964 [Fomitopsis schrenkii]
MSSTPSLNSSIGAALLGNLGAAILFGVTSVQATVYFRNYASDSAKWKCAVTILCLLDVVQLILITVSVYSNLISYHVDPMSLSNWSLKTHVAIAGVSNAIIRGLFCRRLWNFSQKNWVLVIFIAAGATVALAGSIEFSIQAFALGGDVFHISSISYAVLPYNLTFLALFFLLPKLLFNALLATLNSRSALREIRVSMSTSTRIPATTSSRRTSIIPSLRQNYLHSRSSDLSMRTPILTDVSQQSEKLPRVPSSSIRPLTFRTSTKPSFADVESGMYRSDLTSPLASGAYHAL